MLRPQFTRGALSTCGAKNQFLSVVQLFRKESSQTAMAKRLTGREEEVLGLLAQGHVTKEIADKLAVSK